MAAAAVNRPPQAHPGPNGGNLHNRTNSGATSELQDPGLHSTNPDPGSSSHPSHPQHHVSARPVYYVHAPPPPPFLHYQWPMPFHYNPFAGFPGMGYGMVMPPFPPPPPPYMEAPAYILPHPHIQPVDYRRLLNPQVHPPSAPYQNLNQPRRSRPPHTIRVRETVNSEVQTEPTQRGSGYSEGSPLVGSDSGHGTASCSPSSSSSSSQKRGSADVDNNTLPRSSTRALRVGSTCTSGTAKQSFNVLHPTGTKTVQSCIGATLESQIRKDSVGQENKPPCRNSHCNIWSVSSQDSMVPVCSSSQQEEEAVKERRVSVPDILMSWGGGTQQETMLKLAKKPENDHQVPSYETEVEHEKSVTESPTETKNGPVAEDAYANDDVKGDLNPEDSASLFKILKPREALTSLTEVCRRQKELVGLVGSVRHCLPYKDELLHTLNKSCTLHDEGNDTNDTNPHEDTSEIIPNQMSLNGSQMKKKMNESVWSVESLPAFIPIKEPQLHNSVFEPEVIIEMTEEAENGNETAPHEDTTEIIPYPLPLNGSQRKKKMNESVWSVESLPTFIPTKAWLLENSTFEPEVIVEMIEEAENVLSPNQNDNLVKSCKERRIRRCSSSDSVPTANRCLVFSTPAGKRSAPKKPECQSESETDASEMRTPKHGQSMSPSEKDVSASPTHLPSRIILSTPTEEDVGENRSSEPEANQSPNQESLILHEQKKSPCLPEQEKTLLLISVPREEISSPGQLTVDLVAEDGACGNEEMDQLRKGQLCVPMADQKMDVSPSKSHLVDCGVQCNALQEINCVCKELKSNMGPSRRQPSKYPDMRKANNGQAEGFGMKGQKNQRRNGHWRNRGQEKYGSQQEAYNGYCGKPGKPQGGNGRNPRY